MAKTEVAPFVAPKGIVYYRKGAKAPWLEFLIKREDGTEVKLIAKIVPKFYSEEESATL